MMRPILWLATLLCFAAPAAALAQQPQGYGPYMMWDGGWHGWFFGPIMMIVFFAVAVAVVVLLVRWLGGPGHGGGWHAPPGKTPLDILKERFARGEIDKEEFEERRRLLGE
ncbi:MAG TPA: SHOCT domain-containing protein [Kiloniellales bacterium]